MTNAVLQRIAASIKREGAVPKHIVLGKEGYTPVPLSLSNFKPIPQPKQAVVAFIDSGNAELASGPNFSLHFIRTCAIIRGSKTVTEEAFCLVQAHQDGDKLVYKTELIGIEGLRLPTIDLYEQSMAEGTHRVQPNKVAELARVLAEHRLAAWVIPELPVGSFLVRDGDLEAHTLFEQTALREVYERSRIQGVTIAGLSKTSMLLTDTGHSAIPVLMRMSAPGSWYYHPVATSTRPDHQASVCVARLHPKADHAFRIDIFDQHEAVLPDLIAILAPESQDAAFLGYPYGLTEADRYGRVRDEERAYLRLRAEMVFGEFLKAENVARDGHEHLNKAV